MTVKDKVYQLLVEMPKTRDSDRLLIAHVIKDLYGLQNTFDIMLCSTIDGNIYETIRRCRQDIQSDNEDLWPSDPVKRARFLKEKRMREEYSHANR